MGVDLLAVTDEEGWGMGGRGGGGLYALKKLRDKPLSDSSSVCAAGYGDDASHEGEKHCD